MTANATLHIFKSGCQTPMSGEPLTITDADLVACAENYDPALHEAPIVVGHPKDNHPAYGWVKGLTVKGGDLMADVHQVDPAFAELVSAGRYKKISVAFYTPDAPANPKPGSYYLRHVGFLGAQPPAVKGLREPCFADGEAGIVEFGDWMARDTEATLWRRLRDWLIARFGVEAADEVIPNWQVNELHDAALEAQREFDATPSASTPVPLFEENAVTPEEKAALEAENASLKAQLASLEAARAEAAREARHRQYTDFAESLVAAGTLMPKHQSIVVALLDATAGAGVEFAEGEAKKPLDQALREFLADMPKQVAFGEFATKDKAGGKTSDVAVAEYAEKPCDPDRLTLHGKAVALVAEKHIPYAQAVRELLS
jgi:hypothetical protein